MKQQLLKAVLATALTGALIIGAVHYLALPALQQGLTPSQVEWLREAFRSHTALVLAGILAITLLLALPMLLVAMWAARLGPWKNR